MSFSLETKIEAALFPVKKQCCRRAFILGVLLGGADISDDEISLYLESDALAEVASKFIKEQFGRETVPVKTGARGIRLLSFASKSATAFLTDIETGFSREKFVKCDECLTSFLRGIFVGGGTVSDPEKKNYHLELKSRCKENISFLIGIFAELSQPFCLSVRLGKQSFYLKDSEAIEGFLFLVGASKQAFNFVNAKINHEIKNDINRRTNCETGNIARSTASAAKHLAAIRFLIERGRLSELGPELEYTASMRLKNPEISLAQLGQLMTPTVSKPGLYHRLEKICSFAESIKNKEKE